MRYAGIDRIEDASVDRTGIFIVAVAVDVAGQRDTHHTAAIPRAARGTVGDGLSNTETLITAIVVRAQIAIVTHQEVGRVAAYAKVALVVRARVAVVAVIPIVTGDDQWIPLPVRGATGAHDLPRAVGVIPFDQLVS